MLDAIFDVQFTDEAEKSYDELDENMTRRMNRAIDSIEKNPFYGSNIVKLKGKYVGQYRFRVGSYRIIYSVDTTRKKCIIRTIYQRGRAYHR